MLENVEMICIGIEKGDNFPPMSTYIFGAACGFAVVRLFAVVRFAADQLELTQRVTLLSILHGQYHY